MGLVLVITMACAMFGLSPGSPSQNDNASKGDVVVWNVVLYHGYYPANENNVVRLYSSSVPLTVKMSFTPTIVESLNGKVKVEYQICYTTGETCEPQGEWKSDNEVKIADLNLNWQNINNLTFRARFRDAAQKPLFSLNWNDANFHIEKAPQDVSEIHFSVIFVEQEKTQTPEPLPALAITQTYAAATSPVQGSIEVAPGESVIGGTAGSTRQMQVLFSATSMFGKVTEMRLDDGNWQPFVLQKEYTITILLNWSTIQHCVEYRDEKGNISPRYCDGKGVEGSPKSTP